MGPHTPRFSVVAVWRHLCVTPNMIPDPWLGLATGRSLDPPTACPRDDPTDHVVFFHDPRQGLSQNPAQQAREFREGLAAQATSGFQESEGGLGALLSHPGGSPRGPGLLSNGLAPMHPSLKPRPPDPEAAGGTSSPHGTQALCLWEEGGLEWGMGLTSRQER